ncbi:hypothetical protein [Glycomyces arizonensis]|uniref:hypothetical protein n=1 Tax=Glycomyces arizonensis TaxID=256035 RepID=UPI0003F940F1|nr:hypothetical protein [Glycomyces arizonensis]
MKTKYPRAAAIAAAALLPLAVPTAAQADDALSEPVLMHLKDHPDLSLAWKGDTAVLDTEGDRWAFRSVESYDDLGEYLIVHDATGQCLSVADATEQSDDESSASSEDAVESTEETETDAEASARPEGTEFSDERSETAAESSEAAEDTTEAAEETEGTTESSDKTDAETDAEPQKEGDTNAPLTLTDCADAIEWTIVLNDNKDDYRFATPDGRYLGIDRDADVTEGAEVFAVAVKSSRHAQEWRFETPVEPTPEPSTPEQTTPVAQPNLPQTGVGVAAIGGVGLAAVAAGGAMALWWRRRALRGGQW